MRVCFITSEVFLGGDCVVVVTPTCPLLTGRSLIKLGEYIVKMYNDTTECQYEYNVLSEIAHSNPITFKFQE